MTTKLKNILSKKHVDIENLIDYYNNHSLTQTADYFDLSQFIVNKVMIENNIPIHTKQENTEFTNIQKYGCKNVFQCEDIKEKIRLQNLDLYGVEYNFQREDVKESIKQTCKDNYGVEYTSQIPGSREKAKSTILKKFGKDNYNNREKYKTTMLERYGAEVPLQIDKFKDKSIESSMQKYGVPYNCMRKEARMHGNNSKPNLHFAKILEDNGYIESDLSVDNNHYSKEFCIGNYSYDFKIDNILIEINPTITHNSLLVPFSREPLNKNYHRDKSLFAKENNYRCIHIFDWEDENKIVKLISNSKKIYARKCVIKEVDINEAAEFINKYHIQGYAKDSIRIGLYYENNLVSIMTFGTPRYNKNYEYELIRYCSSYNILGGSEKIFKYFLKTYDPHSIVSYCDYSKFDGKTYENLGFKLKSKNINPSKHWYNMKTKKHITDNLLRKRGFDQLFGTNYGKGTSNEDLMINNGFLPIYDCGQATYIYTDNNYTK